MGYMRHHAIAVTSWDEEKLELAYAHARRLGCTLTDIVQSPTNGYSSFFVAPDGSKEGWGESDIGDQQRELLTLFLHSLAYDDGSTSVHWVEVQYGDDDWWTEVVRDSEEKRRAARGRVYAKVLAVEPGPLKPHHCDTETVWYHNAAGEFSYDSYNHSLHDERGNVWGADELRALAAAAVAAANHYDAQKKS